MCQGTALTISAGPHQLVEHGSHLVRGGHFLGLNLTVSQRITSLPASTVSGRAELRSTSIINCIWCVRCQPGSC